MNLTSCQILLRKNLTPNSSRYTTQLVSSSDFRSMRKWYREPKSKNHQSSIINPTTQPFSIQNAPYLRVSLELTSKHIVSSSAQRIENRI